MSSLPGLSLPGDLDQHLLKFVRLRHICDLVPTTILLYDFSVTFTDEVRLYWTGHFSFVSTLFFLNRYFPMLATAPTLVLSFHGSSVERCKHLNLAHQITLLFSQVFIALLLITRTYALYYRNRLIIVPTVLIGVPVTVAILFLFARDHKSGIPFPEGCILLTSQKTGRRIALAYLLSLLFNTAVFTLTVVRPWLPGLRESANNQRKKEIPLVTVMVRDGVFYFFVIIIANLINIANFFRGGPISKGLGATFASNMSSTMMSRLMLNIREQSVLLSRGTVATSTVYESYLTTGLEFTMPVHSVGVETFGEDYELENI